MKRCPTCNKVFNEDYLIYCVDDGTPLVASASEGESDRNAVAYKPPGSYVPPTESKPRRVWPWILGIVGVVVIAVGGLAIAAAVFLPRLARSDPRATNSNSNRTDQTSNQNANQSPDSPPADANSNSNSADNVDSPPPTDKDQVLAQLTDLENEWTVANFNADKKRLDRILADDYTSAAADGHMQGKAEYIRTITRDTSVERWDFESLQLTLVGERASLSGKIHFHGRSGQELVLQFNDRFVWRDGRWQATGSEVKELQ